MNCWLQCLEFFGVLCQIEDEQKGCLKQVQFYVVFVVKKAYLPFL